MSPRLHLILMYITEAVAVVLTLLFIRQTTTISDVYMFTATAFIVITATFHVTYLVLCLEEKLKKLEAKLSNQ